MITIFAIYTFILNMRNNLSATIDKSLRPIDAYMRR